MNVSRFKQLLESKSGNVKPLLFEESTKITGSGKLKNFISKIKTSDIKIKNWVTKIFGKENPTELELSKKLTENPPKIEAPLTPTTEPQPVDLPTEPIFDSIPQTVSESYGKYKSIISESTSTYFNIWNKNQSYVLTQLNYGVTNYILPYVNLYVQNYVIPTWDTCVDLYVSEVCFDVKMMITDFKINSINMWDGNDYGYPDWTLIGMSVSCYLYINIDGFEIYLYPTAVSGAAIYKNEIISFSSPDVKITTSSYNLGLAIVWIEDNELVVYTSITGKSYFDLGLNEEFKKAFKGKIINLKSELPNLYKTSI
jgi:hypothetical protein